MTKKQLMEMGLSEETAGKILAAFNSELDGNYVPKSRFDEKIAELKTTKETIAARDAQLDKLGKTAGDNEALKAQIAELKKQNEADAEKHAAELLATKTKLAAMAALSDAQDADLVYSQLDTTKLTLGDKGKISGLDDQIKELKKTKPFLFKTEAQDGNGAGGRGLGIKIKGSRDGNPAPAGNPSGEHISQGQAIAKLLARQKNTAETSVTKAAEKSYWNGGNN